MDNVREQKKLEVRKLLENAAESPAACYASSISFTPMPYHGDIYNSIPIVDLVYNPIFAHFYTPKLAGALKFFATMGSRILCQRLNPLKYASGEAAWQALQFSPC